MIDTILKDAGWEWKPPYWVLKTPTRIGWNPDTHECVIGYGLLPRKVDSFAELADVLEFCGYDKEAQLLEQEDRLWHIY